jgi:hypothetical protein
MVVDLKPHQSKALKELKNGSVLRGDVGSGKSHTALMYYYNKVCGGVPPMPHVAYRPMSRPKDVYIITTVKNRDTLEWEQKGADFGLGRESNQDGVQMHVDSWNNIAQYSDVTDAFFIFDEQRLVGSGPWVKAFLQIVKNNEWILLSGTPGDTWSDYIAIFLAHGHYKNRTEFLREHAVYSRFTQFPKIEKYIHTRRLEQLRDSVLVEMPFERHTIRHVELTVVDYDQELFERATKQRWHVFEDRPLRDAGELQVVMRKIVNSDPSRAGELMKKLEKHPKLIVFYNFNYELDMLRTVANTLNYPVAEWNGHKHEAIPKTDKWLYLVQYTAGAEGWNCVETDAMVFWSLNYSWKINEQSRGRIDRMNTPFQDLYYYVFRSMSQVDIHIWKSIMTKEDFNMNRYAKKIWDSYVPF